MAHAYRIVHWAHMVTPNFYNAFNVIPIVNIVTFSQQNAHHVILIRILSILIWMIQHVLLNAPQEGGQI